MKDSKKYNVRRELTIEILGRCNCPFSDLHLKQISVPERPPPPVTEIEEMTIPVVPVPFIKK